MTLQQNFGITLKRNREQKGVTQQELSFGAHIDRTYVSMLERGLRQPTLQVLFDLAHALDMNVVDLVGQTAELNERVGKG